MSQEKQTVSDTMFEKLYEKFGTNFFLSCFVMALIAVGYLYYDGKDCEENTLSLEQAHSKERAADKQQMIDYFMQKEKDIKLLQEKAETVQENAENTAAQLSKIKNDLK